MQEYQVAIKIAINWINVAKEIANAFKKKYKHSLKVRKRQKPELKPKQQLIRPSKYKKCKRATIGNNIIVIGN